jgi:hypothetical protein
VSFCKPIVDRHSPKKLEIKSHKSGPLKKGWKKLFLFSEKVGERMREGEECCCVDLNSDIVRSRSRLIFGEPVPVLFSSFNCKFKSQWPKIQLNFYLRRPALCAGGRGGGSRCHTLSHTTAESTAGIWGCPRYFTVTYDRSKFVRQSL